MVAFAVTSSINMNNLETLVGQNGTVLAIVELPSFPGIIEDVEMARQTQISNVKFVFYIYHLFLF